MLNILIVDNNEANSSYLAQNINSMFSDIKIKITKNLSSITKYKNLNEINLVIINLNKRIYHSDFFESINNKFGSKNVPILFLTNNNEFALLKETWDYLQKPLDMDMLYTKLRLYKKLIEYEKEVEKERNFAISMMNVAHCPIFVTDAQDILFANDAFLIFFDCDNITTFRQKYSSISNRFVKKSGFLFPKNDKLESFCSGIKSKNKNIIIQDYDNNEHFFEIRNKHLVKSNIYVVLFQDRTQEVQHNEEIKKLIYTDALTKLPNRIHLIEDLQDNKRNINSLAILDISSFKEINDFYGAKVGDFILKAISESIQKEIKSHKGLRLYKLPSDTYCVSNSNLTKETFTSIIKRTVETIDKTTYHIDQYEIDARIAAGLSFSPKNNKLITADIALQAAKKQHKDYLVFYDELDNLREYQNNMLWTKKLKDAILKDNIIVYYQPLINNQTLEVSKYECLVRMVDGERVVSPFFFLDISKKSNQYTKITHIVIEKSFKAFEHLNCEFSINVSYEDIENPMFLEFVKDITSQYPNIAHRVVFEILEDESIKNYDILISFVKEIKKLGCKVAIDDFGSGYSNFEHLLKMDIDFLKIDASIIKNIAKDESSYKITKTIVEFAKSLNLKTIAEYVENEEIFQIVKKLGVDYSQGYYFSPPVESPNKKICC